MVPRRFLLVLAVLVSSAGCGPPNGVTVYTSLDELYSRPVLKRFEEETGIRVLAVFDTEAQKTTGLYQRILAESNNPRADVFWNSEVARTLQLVREGVLAPYKPPAASDIPAYLRGKGDLWTGFAVRARVLIYNRERLGDLPPPRSIADLAAPRFRGQAAIARPLFGTTATHAGALHAVLGEAGMKQYFHSLVDNQARVVEGNAVVRNLVASGEVIVGLTDTDDAHEAILRGDPVEIVYPDQVATFPGSAEPLGVFIIPNTVALVADSPRPDLGKRLIDYLVSEKVEARLAASTSAQIPVREGLKTQETLKLPQEGLVRMKVSYEDVATGVEASREFLRSLFLR